MAVEKKSTKKVASKEPDMVTIKLVRSLIGSKKDQIATANSLGLRKPGNVTNQPNNVATKGKIAKISHLIEVIKA